MAEIESKIFLIERLREFCTRVFLHFGVPKNDAEQAAEVLACADLRGIDSHGMARMYSYFGMLSEGHINPKATNQHRALDGKYRDRGWRQWPRPGGRPASEPHCHGYGGKKRARVG